MQVWDGVGGGRIEFDWASISAGQRDARNTIAFMVENVNLTNGLLAKLGELGGVEVVGGTKVQSLTYGQDTAAMDLSTWPVVELANGRKIAARLLVGADGANSSVRQFADIESRGWDYERHGLVATLRLAPLSERRSSSNELTSKALTAYQRFLPTGPIALLPLPDNHASLVWSTLPHHAAHLKTLSKRDFLAMVNAAFRLSPVDLQYMLSMASTQAEELAWRAQHTEFPASKIPDEIIDVQDASIASFPLRFRHADTYIRPRIALIGDAAHTVHPLAGQGLNQGQGDVQALADRIAWATERGADIGDMFVLEGYESQRYATNHVLAGTVDKLHKVFALENPLLAGARSWGFGMVNQLSPLKGWLMARAGGG